MRTKTPRLATDTHSALAAGYVRLDPGWGFAGYRSPFFAAVDAAAPPDYFMVNCAHPTHEQCTQGFGARGTSGEVEQHRIQGNCQLIGLGDHVS